MYKQFPVKILVVVVWSCILAWKWSVLVIISSTRIQCSILLVSRIRLISPVFEWKINSVKSTESESNMWFLNLTKPLPTPMIPGVLLKVLLSKDDCFNSEKKFKGFNFPFVRCPQVLRFQ